jgi:hypothetical protein
VSGGGTLTATSGDGSLPSSQASGLGAPHHAKVSSGSRPPTLSILLAATQVVVTPQCSAHHPVGTYH